MHLSLVRISKYRLIIVSHSHFSNITGKHPPHIIEDAMASYSKWEIKLRGVKQYEVVYAEHINPHSILELFRVVISNGMKITFKKCVFDIQCCDNLEKLSAGSFVVELIQCRLAISIHNLQIRMVNCSNK